MWRIRLTDDDLEMVREISEQRNSNKKRHGIQTQKHDAGHDDFEINYFGVLAEVGLARLLCIEPDRSILIGGDGGTDLVLGGKRIQVKNRISPRTKDWFYVNHEEQFVCELGLLCNLTDLQTGILVRGIVKREVFFRDCVTMNFGYGERLAYPAHKLISADALIEATQRHFNVTVGNQC